MWPVNVKTRKQKLIIQEKINQDIFEQHSSYKSTKLSVFKVRTGNT